MRGERIEPDAVSAHYWMSGVAARKLSDAPMLVCLPHGGGAQGARARRGARSPRSAGKRRRARPGGFRRRLLHGIRPAEEPAALPGAGGEVVRGPAGGRRTVPRSRPPGSRPVVSRAAVRRRDLPVRRPPRFREEPAGSPGSVPQPAVPVGREAAPAGGRPAEGTGRAGGGRRLPRLRSPRQHGDAVLGRGRRGLPVPVRVVRAGAAGGAVGGRPGDRAGRDVLGGKDPGGGGRPGLRPGRPGRVGRGDASLLARPAELRARLSFTGPKVAESFTWEKCTGAWVELLASVSTSGGPR